MNWNFTMGIISTAALFLPIALILILRMSWYRTFPALIAYYIIAFVNNFVEEGYVTTSNNLVKYWGLTNNLLDVPLMLFFLIYFCTSALQAKRMKAIILAFVLFEIIVVLFRGYDKEAITIILAPGLAIVFCFCLYFFIRSAKKAITHQKATGKALILTSQLFAYGCFIIIYLMFYVFETHVIDKKINEQYVGDTFLIYFFVTTFSSLLMCAGLIVESKRIQKLAELKITRKELSMIYKSAERAAPFRATLLDFEKD
jgi:hypothetical protein